MPEAESPRVEEIGLDDARWDDYVRSRPEATLFHGPGWQRVAAKTFGYRPYCLLARRGDRTTGILPLAQVPGFPRGSALLSAPLAVYGGAIADDAASGTALLEHARALGSRLGARYLELRDGMRFAELPAKDLYVTFRGTIEPDPEKRFNALTRHKRRSIRVAQKQNLTHRTGRHELVDAFYRIYSHSVRNLGTPVFPRTLFRNLLDEYGEQSEILCIERAGKVVAAVFSFFDRDQALPYYAGALRETFRYSGSDFMYWTLMGVAADRGCRVFDFGRSKRESGSFQYKVHWGFNPTPLAYQYHLFSDRHVPDLSPRNPRFSLAIKIWQRLPLAVTELVGPHLVRYFP